MILNLQIFLIMEESISQITHRSMEFKIDFYGLNRKMKNAQRNGFIFIQINKLTKKIMVIYQI